MNEPRRRFVDWSALGTLSWKEYAMRFAFGGAITAVSAIVATRWGPTVGGLFLAFPAILPASLTLVKKHNGVRATRWTAQGAVAGSIGLGGFAGAVTALATTLPPAVTLAIACAAWLVVSVLALVVLRRK